MLLLRFPSSSLSPFLSTPTPKPKPKPKPSRFSPSSLPRPRRSLFRCAVQNDVVIDAFTEKSGYLFELSASEANSLADYDISRIGDIYRRKPLIVFRRLLQIAITFGKWFALRYIDYQMERSDQMFEVNL